MQYGSEDGKREHHPAAGEIARYVDRRSRRGACPDKSMERARQGDVVDIVPRGLCQWASLAPSGHTAVDESRIVAQQDRGAETEPLHNTGTIAFDQCIRRLYELADPQNVPRLFEIELEELPGAGERITH